MSSKASTRPPLSVKDEVLLWFDAVRRGDAGRVGGTNAFLGEAVSMPGGAGMVVRSSAIAEDDSFMAALKCVAEAEAKRAAPAA